MNVCYQLTKVAWNVHNLLNFNPKVGRLLRKCILNIMKAARKLVRGRMHSKPFTQTCLFENQEVKSRIRWLCNHSVGRLSGTDCELFDALVGLVDLGYFKIVKMVDPQNWKQDGLSHVWKFLNNGL